MRRHIVGDSPEPSWWEVSFEMKAAAVGALGGISFGYDIGVISGALVSLTEDFDLNPSAEGLVVAMIAVGQMPGAIIGGFVTDQVGLSEPLLYKARVRTTRLGGS